MFKKFIFLGMLLMLANCSSVADFASNSFRTISEMKSSMVERKSNSLYEPVNSHYTDQIAMFCQNSYSQTLEGTACIRGAKSLGYKNGRFVNNANICNQYIKDSLNMACREGVSYRVRIAYNRY